MDAEKSLVCAIIEFLNKKKSELDASHESEKSESIEVATQCLSDIFGIDTTDATRLAAHSIAPVTLLDLVQVYLKKKNAASAAPSAASSAERVNNIGDAEEFKKKGNDALAKKDYEEAVRFYSQAIQLNSQNAVYYCNRAAAFSYLSKHELVIEDCEKAIAIDPTYVKAYTRLGLAQASQGYCDDAIETYEKVLELDPSNEAVKASLSQLQQRKTSNASSPSSSAPKGFPGAGGGPGGMDFASLLQNPQMMKMAADLARNGGMAELLKNPNIAQMAQNMLGKDPEALAQMAKSFNGGQDGPDSLN